MSSFGLIDAHCFYVSCERMFRPALKNRPVVVLSSNDGNAVSRSDEAKKLGVKMGQPYFQLKELERTQGLICCSSNYTLYQDMSNRVMEIIKRNVPRHEPYSIDESWADLTGINDMDAFGIHLKNEVFRLTGIPVGIGMANTKTLAKLANWASKKWKVKTDAVVNLHCPLRQQKLLQYADVAEVWGIGRKLTSHLNSMNINTALDLASFDKKTLRKAFNINVEITARELSGEQCLSLETDISAKQEIACTRSFGQKIMSLEHLKEAVSTFVSRASLKLRCQGHYARRVTVFVQTNRFDTRSVPYAKSITVSLDYPSSDTRDLMAAAMSGLHSIYRNGYRYAKAGVILSEFTQPGAFTDDLFAQPKHKNSDALMNVLDFINQKKGRGTIRFCSEPRRPDWGMKQDNLSPAYTTDWNKVIGVQIS